MNRKVAKKQTEKPIVVKSTTFKKRKTFDFDELIADKRQFKEQEESRKKDEATLRGASKDIKKLKLEKEDNDKIEEVSHLEKI
jgi:hypothetical protein